MNIYTDEQDNRIALQVAIEDYVDRKWLAFDTYNHRGDWVYLNREQVIHLISQCEEFLEETKEEMNQ